MDRVTKEQIDLLEEKKKKAEEIIKYYSMGASAVGAIPLPFADAPILIGGQIKMIMDIFKVYGFENTISKDILLGLFLHQIVSQGGKSLTRYLTAKTSLGMGTVINSSIAGTITYTLGKSISKIAYKVSECYLKGDESAQKLENIRELIDNAISVSFSCIRK